MVHIACRIVSVVQHLPQRVPFADPTRSCLVRAVLQLLLTSACIGGSYTSVPRTRQPCSIVKIPCTMQRYNRTRT